MTIIEKNDSEGVYLLIKREGKYYRTESFATLASLYTHLPLKVWKVNSAPESERLGHYNLETKETFGTLDLSNVGTYMLDIL